MIANTLKFRIFVLRKKIIDSCVNRDVSSHFIPDPVVRIIPFVGNSGYGGNLVRLFVGKVLPVGLNTPSIMGHTVCAVVVKK